MQLLIANMCVGMCMHAWTVLLFFIILIVPSMALFQLSNYSKFLWKAAAAAPIPLIGASKVVLFMFSVELCGGISEYFNSWKRRKRQC